MISLSFSGDRKLAEAIRKLSDASKKRIERAVIKSANDINTDVKNRIDKGPKTGIEYVRGRVRHRASAPGEAPATDTGRLVGSIAYRQTGPMSAEVKSNEVEYARHLEFGTLTIKPRPAWTPAVEAERPKFRARLEKIIREETRR